MVEPYKFSEINLNKLIYSKPKQSGNKKVVLIKYNDNNKPGNLVFQTPSIYNLTEPDIKKGYGEIEVALHGKEKNRIDDFTSFLLKLENQVKQDAKVNASSWFDLNEENESINFQKLIREMDGLDSGILKLKLIKNNDFETELINNVNSKKIKLSLDEVPCDCWCKMLLEVYAIWINTNNDFGIFLRPVLVVFTPTEKKQYNYKMIEESDSDKEDEFEIPDTEINDNINTNIFMSLSNIKQNKNNNTTSVLELDNLKLNSDDSSSSLLESSSVTSSEKS
jgi:hypothetical protein